ncbi:MAG: pyridoxamine 5'-phosphate oxidase [Geodermatophilaceae bacterium]|nr:pyridoxamine 5'-phosphate oxidase [Geodermatophilaceae bacterium]
MVAGRIEYGDTGLTEDQLATTWLEQFRRWFDDAVQAGIPEPNAVVLATVGADSMPAARLVLMKSYGEAGIVVFTNGDSAKGRELAANPYAALVFPWHSLHRQVRLSGPVEGVDEAVSDAYFASRPYGARIAARVSRQSEVISGRTELEADWAAQARAYPEGGEVPRPAGWQGYRVRPESVEFWAGRQNRLHDRLRFRRTEDGWVTERLAP